MEMWRIAPVCPSSDEREDVEDMGQVVLEDVAEVLGAFILSLSDTGEPSGSLYFSPLFFVVLRSMCVSTAVSNALTICEKIGAQASHTSSLDKLASADNGVLFFT